MAITFTKKKAREIAITSYHYMVDCLQGISDSGYDLGTLGIDFQANFEEDIEQLKITVTDKRIKMCIDEYEKLRAKAEKKVETLYIKQVE